MNLKGTAAAAIVRILIGTAAVASASLEEDATNSVDRGYESLKYRELL